MWTHNEYIEPVKFPARLGYEPVGTVDSVGRDVATVAVGHEPSTKLPEGGAPARRL